MKRAGPIPCCRLLLIVLIPLIFVSCKSPGWTGSESGPPNILFAIADDASWQHFGAYGCEWVRTPALDKIASEGILFTRAYTPNAKCAPSRSCILTGRNSWQLKAAANHVPFFFQACLAPMWRCWRTMDIWSDLRAKDGRPEWPSTKRGSSANYAGNAIVTTN